MSDGSATAAFSGLLDHVLDPRQGVLDWHRGVWAASLLCELQDGHVAEWTHLPHLQPLNEAPVGKQTKERKTGDFKIRGGVFRGAQNTFMPSHGQCWAKYCLVKLKYLSANSIVKEIENKKKVD